jgi:hypothetical protein
MCRYEGRGLYSALLPIAPFTVLEKMSLLLSDDLAKFNDGTIRASTLDATDDFELSPPIIDGLRRGECIDLHTVA